MKAKERASEIPFSKIKALGNKMSTYYGTKIDSCDEIEFLKGVK